MAWYFLDQDIGAKAPSGKNKIPQHDQWGLTIVECGRNREVIRYLHEDGGWFTMGNDPGAPIRPMIYATVSGSNKAVLESAIPMGERGRLMYAVYTAPRCEDPRGKAWLIARHLGWKIID